MTRFLVYILASLLGLISVDAVLAANFVVSNTNDSGAGSLRQALLDANANGTAQADRILFVIPGSLTQVITPLTPLPVFGPRLSVDGYSQGDATQNSRPAGEGSNALLRIVLDGSALSADDDLIVVAATAAQPTTVRGLILRGLPAAGTGAGARIVDGAILRGNFFATGNDGNSAASLGAAAIEVSGIATSIVIGGAAPADVNVIGSTPVGILMQPAPSAEFRGGVVEGNLIGIGANGAALGHASGAVRIGRPGVILRGNEIVCSGGVSGAPAVLLERTADEGVLEGNRIGVTRILDPVGDACPNTGVAVQIDRADDVRIGSHVFPNELRSGTTQQRAIEVRGVGAEGQRNDVTRNLFLRGTPAGLPIDLTSSGSSTGITQNDALDIDVGGNGLQNFPVIHSAVRAGPGEPVIIDASFDGAPNSVFLVTYHAGSAAQRSSLGHGAAEFLSSTSFAFATDGDGHADLGAVSVEFGDAGQTLDYVSASATAIPAGVPTDSSEFGPNVQILPANPAIFVVNSTADPGVGGCDLAECTLREAILAANASVNAESPDRIHFDLPGEADFHSIVLAADLPAILQPLVIDGYTQAGAQANTDSTRVGTNAVLKVEIASAVERGVLIGSNDVTLRGLAIANLQFSYAATDLAGIVFEGNWFGLGPDATPRTGFRGVNLGSVAVRFGGSAFAQRNLVTSWIAASRALRDASGETTVIDNNQINLAPDGTTPIGAGAALDARNGVSIVRNSIASTKPEDFAVVITRADFSNNALGIGFNGAQPYPMPGGGIEVRGRGNRINSNGPLLRLGRDLEPPGSFPGVSVVLSLTGAEDAAVKISQPIENSAGAGVRVSDPDPTGLPARSVASIAAPIRNSAGLGIDLVAPNDGPDGVTPNDALDADIGPNGLQNFPVLLSATRTQESVDVSASLHSVPSSLFVIRWCGIIDPDPSGHGECDVLAPETLEVSTDAGGNVDFETTITIPPGFAFLTATASRVFPSGAEATSEFAQNLPIQGEAPAIFADGFEPLPPRPLASRGAMR